LQGGIVGTLMTNMAVEVDLKNEGIDFERTKVGDRYVMQSLKKNGWKLGGESSGHVICLDYNSTGDGIVAALQVLKALKNTSQTLTNFSNLHPLFPQELINVRVENADVILAKKELKELVANVEKELGDSGRVLIRKSGTEPLIRVMVEAKDETTAENYANMIASQVQELV